ncbi:lecithin retinol acyltransferase [Medicago truncatula]|uniref:Lecithin retinol acyltransferase n=3 Tax=Medicago truncatula TaxID=3880 RepID=G7J785_MEDTR|nr:lecithin retinol acyltransferase [Medicago truncatula]
MEVLSNKIDRKQLKTGDHIYSWRQAYVYAHHGIYIGDEMVIHFTIGSGQQATGIPAILDRFFTSSAPSFDTKLPCQRCREAAETRNHGVFSSCLDCFLSGGQLYLFQYGVSKLQFLAQARGGTCTLASSDPTEEVLPRALYLLEKGFGCYHISKNNCEDFAVYCKTGLFATTKGCSGQAASYLAATSTVASSSFRFVNSSLFGKALVGCGTYCIKRLVSDIGFRYEVIKDVTKVPVERIPELTMEASRLEF